MKTKIDFTITVLEDEGNHGIQLVNSLQRHKISHKETKQGIVSFLVNSYVKAFTVNVENQSFLISGLPYKK